MCVCVRVCDIVITVRFPCCVKLADVIGQITVCEQNGGNNGWGVMWVVEKWEQCRPGNKNTNDEEKTCRRNVSEYYVMLCNRK